MHSLIITAHPSTQGFTHSIAEKYAMTKEKNGHTVEILDLYRTDLRLDFYQYEEKSDMKNLDPIQLALQTKITEADELIFVFPTWWVNVPAILKNFFDAVLTSGFAYRYKKGGGMFPEKLLKGKTAKIFCTCDAIGLLYWFIGNPLRVILQIGTMGWCGIRVKNYVVFDQMRKRTDKERQNMLAKVERIANK